MAKLASPRANWAYWVIISMLLLGAGLRFHALGQDVRLHPDEAFFTTFARRAAINGAWMLPGPLDKSPLSIYASALSMHLFVAQVDDNGLIQIGIKEGEFAARLPNIFAGIVLIAMIYALAKKITPKRNTPAVLATLLAVCSPYLIAFSAAAFTDMFMVVFMVAALLMALRHRPAAAGILLALSVASKQQGIFYLPLIIGVLWAYKRPSWRWWAQFGITLTAGIMALLLWDAARPDSSIFAVASANNNPEHLIYAPVDWLPRLQTWLNYAGWLVSAPLITGVVIGVAFWGIITGEYGRLHWIMLVYCLAFFGLHWIIGFNIYDRYLLPVAPLLVVLVGAGVTDIARRIKAGQLMTVMGCLLLTIPAYQAASRQVDLGRDHYPLDREGAIIALADYLNAKPLGTIIYDRWLGWEMNYYLGGWTDKRRVYYPTPALMVEDARLNPERGPRYFIALMEQDVNEWLRSLRMTGFTVQADYRNPRYKVYEITLPAYHLQNSLEMEYPALHLHLD